MSCARRSPKRSRPRSRWRSSAAARSARSDVRSRRRIPWIWGGLLGVEDATPTLGGLLACNLAGPRRVKAGAARDHFLGFHAVSGRGEIFKAGGKVVKNVTGYDLPKLLAGSYGTLAALEEVTIKVLPQAEEACTVVLY